MLSTQFIFLFCFVVDSEVLVGLLKLGECCNILENSYRIKTNLKSSFIDK